MYSEEWLSQYLSDRPDAAQRNRHLQLPPPAVVKLDPKPSQGSEKGRTSREKGDKSVCITLPYPPSANRYWRTFRGRTTVSEEAKDYKSAAKQIALLSGASVHKCAVAVTIRIYRPRKSGDLDNRIKVLLDSMNGILYDDDKRIVEIHAYRYEDKSNPRAEIEVREAI